jgi:hypothetical protein
MRNRHLASEQTRICTGANTRTRRPPTATRCTAKIRIEIESVAPGET